MAWQEQRQSLPRQDSESSEPKTDTQAFTFTGDEDAPPISDKILHALRKEKKQENDTQKDKETQAEESEDDIEVLDDDGNDETHASEFQNIEQHSFTASIHEVKLIAGN